MPVTTDVPKYAVWNQQGQTMLVVKLDAQGELPPEGRRKFMRVCAYCFDADLGTGGLMVGGYCTNCDGKGN